MILGIDTAAGQCAAALLAPDGRCLARRAAPMTRGHAEHLWPMIEAVLAEAGARYADLERIGVCTGPGSFTGIRVGVAAARGLALGLGVPAIGVGRLEALAAGAGRATAVLVAGPRGRVFHQEFDAAGHALGDPALCDSPPQAMAAVGDGLPGAAPADGLADPAVIARLAAAAEPGAPPAPLYLREADADPPRQSPPVWLD
ncbi:tRNA (adenosine(37)-N6)-threonylcarbamoyltransferase complex dimerization subunit type 1 TsaB [Paralimibaculum aggregatum]|uniref:tRNA (Adenosine(37)-N6)-threonylcarbamoyltransferase complex dimerization subunit type 1 TsaB n=1 Tax=Paralimibaculum aggregatum TaxID=3036245 RepID=A0ABQ6LJF9_9RHOB|nr:tRNA (adenosine(37)-N6)-threonylcarbamoyltransferase complex dimerization subunit type 1 TsaB [Limibaculum sp. NKW23]GMG83400.1 tRNA (adenosine(37)-N6)-threonylcarbamoyltransferase complex dimerization subunit type 1 TsaB [Limibaculum sp. NKW23]